MLYEFLLLCRSQLPILANLQNENNYLSVFGWRGGKSTHLCLIEENS